MNCPDCKIKMIRRKSKFGNNYWWGCSNYPKCKVTCAEHPDGSQMSTPADQELKDLRKKAHKLCEEIWGDWENCDKKEMYDWLKENTHSGHIGLMDEGEIKDLIEQLEAKSLESY